MKYGKKFFYIMIEKKIAQKCDEVVDLLIFKESFRWVIDQWVKNELKNRIRIEWRVFFSFKLFFGLYW